MFFWQSLMCWLATTAPSFHLQCKALTGASLPSTCWVALNFQALHYLWLIPSSWLEIWPKLARDLKSNCRATNRWADWCHEQKKSDSRIFTSSLITSLASDTIFCLKKTSFAFSPALHFATTACNYPTEMQILWSFHQKSKKKLAET